MMVVNLSPDIVALMVMMIMGISGILTPAESFSGFSSQAVITLMGAFIMTRALTVTGVTQKMGKVLTLAATGRKDTFPLVVMAVSSSLSLFMNKVVAAAILLPVTTHAAKSRSTPLFKVMMPLAFATSLGGMATLLNTGNLVVSETLSAQGFASYGLLEFIPVGMPVAIIGIFCIWLLLKLFTPQVKSFDQMSTQSLTEKLTTSYQIGKEVNIIHIPNSSTLAGKSLAESELGDKYAITVLAIQRKKKILLVPAANELLFSGDRLIVSGGGSLPEHLMEMDIHNENNSKQLEDLIHEGNSFFEIIPSIRSNALGQSLKQIHFRERFGASVVTIWDEGHSFWSNLGNIPLHPGCALLVYGPNNSIYKLKTDPDFMVTQAPFDSETPERPGRALLAIVIILSAMVISALQIMPVSLAMFAGALLMTLTGCINIQEAYQAVDWRTIFLIAGMSSISVAMTKTGAAELISNLIIDLLAPFGHLALAGTFMFLTMLFTQVVSGQVAAFFLAPVAISAAVALQVDPRALAMYVAFGASLTFLTPAAHSANLLVMGTGGYLPRDYFRLGLPLTAILFVCILLIVPIFFPF